MAIRRMFASAIVLSDAFLDMPASARCLYYSLGMEADDDGFVNNPRSVMRQTGASEEDLQELIGKRFLLGFQSGVVCIKHWRINNYIRGDRYTETNYLEEKELLAIDARGAYTEAVTGVDGSRKPVPLTPVTRVSDPGNQGIDTPVTSSADPGNQGMPNADTQVRGGKVRGGKVRLGEGDIRPRPTLVDVEKYCKEAELTAMDPEKFYDHYAAKGWAINGEPIADWKARARKWNREDLERAEPGKTELDKVWEKLSDDKGRI